MKKIKLNILGGAVLATALFLNFRHALNDYGVKDNKLHVEVLAQSNTTTTSGGVEVTFTSGQSFSYTWVQCINTDQIKCTPVERTNCN